MRPISEPIAGSGRADRLLTEAEIAAVLDRVKAQD